MDTNTAINYKINSYMRNLILTKNVEKCFTTVIKFKEWMLIVNLKNMQTSYLIVLFYSFTLKM